MCLFHCSKIAVCDVGVYSIALGCSDSWAAQKLKREQESLALVGVIMMDDRRKVDINITLIACMYVYLCPERCASKKFVGESLS